VEVTRGDSKSDRDVHQRIRGWRSETRSFEAERGKPRLGCGKEEIEQPRVEAMVRASSSDIFIGMKLLLSKFM